MARGLLLLALVFAAACRSFSPQPLDEVPFLERAQQDISGPITIRAAVPSRSEAKQIYGANLASAGIQPIWIEARNADPEKTYWFLRAGTDPHGFAPAEAAYAIHKGRGQGAAEMEEHFEALEFSNPVRPGETVSGFVLVNLDEGYKALDIDLISRNDLRSFTLVFVDPDFKADVSSIDLDTIWSPEETVELEDEPALRAAIREMPRFTTNKKGTAEGDPLNLVLIGKRRNILAAMVRRGWHATEIISAGSLWRTAMSFLKGNRYRYSPISALYVYGRSQDFSAQKARGSINERNHMRFWLTPYRYEGKEVWVGQISRDIGVKFTFKSPTISTHVIDPDVDEARRYLVEDMAYSQALSTLAFEFGTEPIPRADPRYNLVGDPFFTDGMRAIMMFERRPYSLEDVRIPVWADDGAEEAAR